MENLVINNAISCNIFRLPQIVGIVFNNTLVSHFTKLISQNFPIKLQSRATRNLVDIRDLARVIAFLVQRNMAVGVPQNIASSTQVPVTAIVQEIASLLKQPYRTVILDEGYSQNIDISFLRTQLSPNDPLFAPSYWKVVLSHYVPLIASGM
jgi:nucleoside-diphosphate-sugar epimerase